MKSRYIVSGIVRKGDKIVLSKIAKGRPPYTDAWHLPGGGVGDAAKAAELFQRTDFDNPYFHDELRREIREELSIEVKNIRCVTPGYIKEPDENEMVYFCDYVSGELAPSDDMETAEWVPKAKLADYNLAPRSQKLFQELGLLTYKNPDGSVASPLDFLPLWPLMSAVAWQTAGPLLLLGIGGALLDRRLHTAPILLLLGVVASIGVSYILVRGTVRRLQRQINARTRHKES